MFSRLPSLLSLRNGKFFINKIKYLHNSALYITGDKAHNNFAVLTPHLDIEERFADRDALDRNVKARGKYFDLNSIADRWMFYMHIKDRKDILGFTKDEIGRQLKKLYEDKVKNKDDIDKLKGQLELVKDEYSTLKNFLYGVEESAALKALSLPNVLHSKTPDDKELILSKFNENNINPTVSHMKLGVDNEYLEYHNPSFTFLINDAALFEQAVINYAHSFLLDNNLTQFSNADFVKTIVVEGCGVDYEKQDIITLSEGQDHPINRLHLTGGASHYAFMAYFTKHLVQPKQLPLRYFAIGRKYQTTKSTDEISLFNIMQHSCVELFIACKDTQEDLDREFDDVVKLVTKLYEQLGYHFRIVVKTAKDLQDYESLRLSIEMFSNYMEKYVEVGNVTICDNYLSKRLLFTYKEGDDRKFPRVIIGNLLNVQKLLACVIENNAAAVDDSSNNILLLNDLLTKFVNV